MPDEITPEFRKHAGEHVKCDACMVVCDPCCHLLADAEAIPSRQALIDVADYLDKRSKRVGFLAAVACRAVSKHLNGLAIR